MRSELAETFALRALAWLAGEEDLLGTFLGATGTSADDIRNRAADPEFLGSVLDFLLMNDDWVIQFCDAQKLPYEQVQQARQALPGGAQINWT
jgi:hypothetical protein